MLIEIEGCDKAGKETQTELLVQNLSKMGYQAVSMSFPNYESETGTVIQDILYGLGPFSIEDSPEAFQSLMVINRYEAQERIHEEINSGHIVVCDRYIASGMTYGAIEDINLDWYQKINYSIRKPDVTIYLDISEGEYKRRCQNYSHLDLNELDLDKWNKVRDLYWELALKNKWIVVDGTSNPETVAENILSCLKPKLEKLTLTV